MARHDPPRAARPTANAYIPTRKTSARARGTIILRTSRGWRTSPACCRSSPLRNGGGPSPSGSFGKRWGSRSTRTGRTSRGRSRTMDWRRRSFSIRRTSWEGSGGPGPPPPATARGILESSGELLGASYMKRLEKMFVYILGYTRPRRDVPPDRRQRQRAAGPVRAPRGGRRVPIAICCPWGGELFDRDDFRSGSGSASEETAWLFPSVSPPASAGARPPASAAFPDAGGVHPAGPGRSPGDPVRAARMRRKGGPTTTTDNLGFELCAGGRDVSRGSRDLQLFARPPRRETTSGPAGPTTRSASTASSRTVFTAATCSCSRAGSEAEVLSWRSDGEAGLPDRFGLVQGIRRAGR